MKKRTVTTAQNGHGFFGKNNSNNWNQLLLAHNLQHLEKEPSQRGEIEHLEKAEFSRLSQLYKGVRFNSLGKQISTPSAVTRKLEENRPAPIIITKF